MSFSNYRKTKKAIAEKYVVRRPLSFQQALEPGELGNIYWLPALDRLKSEVARRLCCAFWNRVSSARDLYAPSREFSPRKQGVASNLALFAHFSRFQYIFFFFLRVCCGGVFLFLPNM